MLILAVDTSTRIGSLAAFRDDELLGDVFSEPGEPYSSRLFRDLNNLLSRIGVSLDQFDLFAVGAGPGSFTGLRVGLTAVKAWAELYGRPIAAVSGLEAVAEQAPPGRKQVVGSVIDAKRGQVFGALYRNDFDDRTAQSVLQLVSEEMLMDAQEFLGLALEQLEQTVEGCGGKAAGTLQFVSPTPEALEVAMQSRRLCSSCVHKASAILAPSIGRLGYQKARRGEVVDALHLDANYVRRPDAEVKWKGF